jgi:hypothetical protein
MIEKLIDEEKELLNAISENRKKQQDYYTNLFCEKNKIKIGDLIRFKEGEQTFIGILDHFEYSGVKPIYPIILLLNKDMKIGKREKKCWISSIETIEVIPLEITNTFSQRLKLMMHLHN